MLEPVLHEVHAGLLIPSPNMKAFGPLIENVPIVVYYKTKSIFDIRGQGKATVRVHTRKLPIKNSP